MSESLKSPEHRPNKRQVTIRGILFATTLIAVAAAGFSGLMRTRDDELPLAFVLVVVAGPLALMIVLSLLRTLERFASARRTDRKPPSDEAHSNDGADCK